MHEEKIRDMLDALKKGDVSVDDVLTSLKDLPFADLGFAKIDHHRFLRRGLPEVIFCQNKTPEHIVSIVTSFVKQGIDVFGTKVNDEQFGFIKKSFENVTYNEVAHTFRVRVSSSSSHEESTVEEDGCDTKKILVVSAGTSDIPIAEEAVETIKTFAGHVETLYDVGVAGIHRLLSFRETLNAASCIIVVAGMDGALPSVVAGIVSCPVIAVPTSVGYGASFDGIGPLLTMLNSCSPGVAVMNIDNGFGAGYFSMCMLRV